MKLLNSVTFRLFKRDGFYVVSHRENDVSFPWYEAVGIPVTLFGTAIGNDWFSAWFGGVCLGVLVYSLAVYISERWL